MSTKKNIAKRAFLVAIVVGVLLNLINQWDNLFSGDFSHIGMFKVLLTFMVPYLVSTFSSVLSKVSLRPGEVANISARVKCSGCGHSEIDIVKGDWVPFCTKCGGETKWKIVQLLENNEALQKQKEKSLSLFAQFNPNPVIRIDKSHKIQSFNDIVKFMFGDNFDVGKSIHEFLPDLDPNTLNECIAKGLVLKHQEKVDKHDILFELRGIPEMNSCQLYAADITDLMKAREKANSMALFANLNPEPVFRFDEDFKLVEANPSAKNAFPEFEPGLFLKKLFPFIDKLNIHEIIENNKQEIINAKIYDKHFRFMLQGISNLKICQVYSSNISELMKAREKANSMALFAKLNPEPVFRFDKNLSLIESNPAANESFTDFDKGILLDQIFPFLTKLDVGDFIKNDRREILTINLDEKHYRFMLRGISDLGTCQVYSSDITKMVEAEKTIRQQTENIQSSIRYASRIQGALLPSKKNFNSLIPENFILFQPRDIVSGDFFWITEKDGKVIFAAADCTGHGVPGAFMSMLGVAFLNQILSLITELKADEILNLLREKVINSLSDTDNETGLSDGMDIALCIVDKDNRKIQFSGANNPLWIFRNDELIELKADRMPIGRYIKDTDSFQRQDYQLEEGDVCYVFSDGYRDQVGGEQLTKMTKRGFREKLFSIHKLPMEEQRTILEDYLSEWKKNYYQIDDILVIGFSLDEK